MKPEELNKISNKINYYAIFMFINTAFFFLLHLTFAPFTNDELYFMEYKKGFSSLFELIADRYKTDSSRVLSETVLFWLLGKPFIIFQILDTLMCIIVFKSLCNILVNDKYSKLNIIVFMAFASYPYMHVGSAGWICTSTNYMWPLATVLYALSGMIKLSRGEKLKVWQYILALLAMIFTANTEMSATYLFLIFGVALITSCVTKQNEKGLKAYQITGVVTGLIGIIFAFTAPGNGERTAMEAANWMPEFPDLNVFEKLRLCSVFVFEHFVAIPDIIFILFAVLLAVFGIRGRKKLWEKIVVLIPLVITVIYTICYGIKYILAIIDDYKAGNGIKINYNFETPSIYPEGKEKLLQYLEFASLYIYIIAAVIALILIIKEIKAKVSAIALLGAGFAVRMALMLSPTMFSSWHRTLIFMYFGYIISCIIMIRQEMTENTDNADNKPVSNWTKRLIYGILLVGIIVNIVLTVGLQIRKG